MKFRKKPVVIDATQLTYEVLVAFLWDNGLLPTGVVLGATSHHPIERKLFSYRLWIETLEGKMEVMIDDWIITGIKGERYPCKPDIFAATYDPVI